MIREDTVFGLRWSPPYSLKQRSSSRLAAKVTFFREKATHRMRFSRATTSSFRRFTKSNVNERSVTQATHNSRTIIGKLAAIANAVYGGRARRMQALGVFLLASSAVA